jgi:hypothetical protein
VLFRREFRWQLLANSQRTGESRLDGGASDVLFGGNRESWWNQELNLKIIHNNDLRSFMNICWEVGWLLGRGGFSKISPASLTPPGVLPKDMFREPTAGLNERHPLWRMAFTQPLVEEPRGPLGTS